MYDFIKPNTLIIKLILEILKTVRIRLYEICHQDRMTVERKSEGQNSARHIFILSWSGEEGNVLQEMFRRLK